MRKRNVPCLKCGIVVYTDGSYCIPHTPKRRGPDRRPSRLERGRRDRKKWSSKIRPRVLKRAGYKCQACGAAGVLDVHHLVRLSDGGSDRLENLVALCKPCHKAQHSA